MRIRWTGPSEADLTHICDYTDSDLEPAQARRAAMAIYEAADTLKDMPLLGRGGRKPGTCELTISGFPFLIIYRAGKDTVELLRVLHGSQQWP